MRPLPNLCLSYENISLSSIIVSFIIQAHNFEREEGFNSEKACSFLLLGLCAIDCYTLDTIIKKLQKPLAINPQLRCLVISRNDVHVEDMLFYKNV